ncbi:MAG TPA: TetR/AcrR family transcriptional regulator [Baekduia sp.]|nr:TetR/AcrR family transcriptional regulator [Baekduia sp.]
MSGGRSARILHGSRADRRRQLVEHLIPVVERELDAGRAFAELTADELASAGGISRTTFYVYFEDMGALLRAVTQGVQADFVAVVRRWAQAPPGLTRQELRVILGDVVAAYRRHEALLGAVMDACGYDLGVREAFFAMVGEIEGDLARHLRDGRAAGALAADLDPDATAAWLIAMFERGLHLRVRGSTDADAERFTEAVTRLVFQGVYAGGPASGPSPAQGRGT